MAAGNTAGGRRSPSAVRYVANDVPRMATRERSSFFFQAEDGIRDYKVTGVQTCALPICHRPPHFQHIFAGDHYAAGYYSFLWSEVLDADAFNAFEEVGDVFDPAVAKRLRDQIGRASCRERV